MSYIIQREIDGDVETKLLKVLNGVIRCFRSVFHIHFMVGGSHNPNSYHYKGMAADGHKGRYVASRRANDADIQIMATNLKRLLDKPNKSVFEQAIIARLRGMQGVGMYPHWKPAAGLHLDVREKPLAWVGLSRDEILKKLKKTNGKQVYFYLV
jgi:hypothetical protein